jgi:membrane-associated phospholipid phosphatase
MKRRGLFVRPMISAGMFLVVSCPAFSQDQRAETPYELRMKTDLPIFGAAGGAALVSVFVASKVNKTCPCYASNVNRFDRSTTTRDSDTLDRISTGAVIAALAWPSAAMFFDASSPRDALPDALITGQAVLVNVALNQTIKFAVHRPRPLLYGLPKDEALLTPKQKEVLGKDDNYFSFYSQHTSVVFAAGISYARTFALRHPHSRYRWLVYTAAAGGGATVGSLRVLSGRHFPTDVLMGAAAGTSIGFLIPQLHRKNSLPVVSIVPTGSGAALSVQVPLGGRNE